MFLQDKQKIPHSVSMFSHLPSLSLALSLSHFCHSSFFLFYYLQLSQSPCSGSGSGNRSVTCHYWSNSVIRHRALTVCSTLYAGTAGVLRTGLEIRFDTHTSRRTNRAVCVCVCAETKVQRQWSRNDSQYGISQGR